MASSVQCWGSCATRLRGARACPRASSTEAITSAADLSGATALADRTHAHPRASFARGSRDGVCDASGRSEGRDPTRDVVARAATKRAPRRASRLRSCVWVAHAWLASSGLGRRGRGACVARRRRGVCRVCAPRELRVLATPLGPAGCIRGGVLVNGELQVLGDRARHLTRLGAWHRASRARVSRSSRRGVS
jgi:hypothetical protein